MGFRHIGRIKKWSRENRCSQLIVRTKRRLSTHPVIVSVILFSIIATQAFLLWIYTHKSRSEFLYEIRHYFVIGIIITVIYKHFIVLMMSLTDTKKPLDRAFIWQTEAVALLFVYSFITIEWPLRITSYPILAGWLWLNIWVNIFLSSAFVVYYLWCERLSHIYWYVRWNGWPGRKLMWELLRGRKRYQ